MPFRTFRCGSPKPPPPVEPLPHDPAFIGPDYYSRWSKGPSTSMDEFPILVYHLYPPQWSGLPDKLNDASINGIYMAYDQSDNAAFSSAQANGWTIFIASGLNNIESLRTPSAPCVGYAMADEPNQDGSIYSPSGTDPIADPGGNLYVTHTNSQRAADPNRPIIGNFTKDVFSWQFAPSGWTGAQFEAHMNRMLDALDITSADVYGWSDPYEYNQADGGSGPGHFGAWVYGEAIKRQMQYNPNAPAYGFVEGCCSGDSPPANTMMPGMIESAIWNCIVAGARGYTIWPRDFYHADDNEYPGVSFSGEFSLFGDADWANQYNKFVTVNAEVASYARPLNSPTVTGITASGTGGVPVATLGKDSSGKLWLLAQANGDASHQMSNTTTMTGTITLPTAIAPGTVFDVLGESRTVVVNGSRQIVDSFGTVTETPTYSGVSLTYGYQKHIYLQR